MSMDYEKKLKLMIGYKRKTGKEITFNTVYKGYNIGSLRNNIRAKYRNGKLNISDKLLQKYKDNGIILEEREKKQKSSQYEKYKFLMENCDKDFSEFKDIKMENGFSMQEVKQQLQTLYNCDKSLLTKKQIKDLMYNGFLKVSPKERQKLIEKYGLPEEYVIEIDKAFGSRENFINAFKIENESSKHRNIFRKINKLPIFKSPKIISISSEDITEQEKSIYANIALYCLKSNENYDLFFQGIYLDIDQCKFVFSCLNINEQKCLMRRIETYDSYRKTYQEIANEIGLTRERCRQIGVKAINKIKNLNEKYEIIKSVDKFDKQKNECDLLINDIDKVEEILDLLHKIKETSDFDNKSEDFYYNLFDKLDYIKNKNFYNEKNKEKEKNKNNHEHEHEELVAVYANEYNMPIEVLELSNRMYNFCRRYGIDTVKQFMSLDDNELKNKKGIGKASLEEFNEKKNLYLNKLKQKYSDKIKDSLLDKKICFGEILKERLEKKLKLISDELNESKEIYYSAKEFYLYKEDILNPNAVIPATIKRKEKDFKESDEVKLEKIRKLKQLMQLNRNLDEQIEKQESSHEIQEKGIDENER